VAATARAAKPGDAPEMDGAAAECSAPRMSDATPLLRQGPFLLFLVSRVLSAGAMQVLVVAVGWQLYALTGSALDLGLVGLAQFLPVLLLTLPAGHAADRFPRQFVLAACRLAAAATAVGLALGSLGGWLDRGAILALVTLLGATRAFEMPAQQSLLPGVVGPAQIPRATALSSSAGQVAFIAGPALGGALYGFGGPGIVYLLAGLALGAAAVMVALIARAPRLAPPGRTTLASVVAGIGFIRQRPILLGAMSLDMVAVFAGGAAALLPIYAKDILGTGPLGLGLRRAAPAAGALGMSLLLAWRPLGGRAGQKMFAAVLLFAAATVLFGVSASLPLCLATLAVLGAADVVSVVVRQSLVQLGTPDEMRGRVAAVNSLFIGASNQLGEFRAGVSAAVFGPVAAVALGGLATIALTLLWLRLFPALAKVDRLEDVVPERR
jgi:MFS family permease